MKLTSSLRGTVFLCVNIMVFTIITRTSNAATITTAASGNWSSAATWNISLTRPGTVSVTAGQTDVTGSALASFTTTLSVGSQILNTSNVVIGTVASIQSATSLTLTSGATASMTNAGWNSRGVGPGDAVSISSGRTVTVDGNYTCASIAMSTVSAQTGVTISGTNVLTVTGAITMARPASSAYNCSLNIGAGSVSMASLTMSATTSGRNDIISLTTGSLSVGNITSGTTGCQITATGSATINISGSSIGTFTLSPGSSSTVIYRGGTSTCRPATYYNLILGGIGIKTITSCTVNNILQIDSTTTLNAAITYGASAGLKYNTTIARTASLFEWPATFSGTGGVTITNTGTITMNAAKVFNAGSELIINANATLNTGNFAIDLGGDYINNGGTSNAGSSKMNIAGTAATQSIAGFTTTGTVTLTKTAGTATFTGDVTSGPLTLNGTGGSLSCGVGRTHTFTKFTRGPGTLLGGSSTINITDSAYLSTGSFTAETSTVRWISNEAAQDISSVTYYNVEFGGSSVKTTYTFTTINNNFLMSGTASTTASANLSVGGNFTIGDGNVYNTAAFSLSVAGTTTIGSGTGGSLDINASTTSVSFGNLIVNSGGTITNDANLSYTIAGNLTNNGNYNSGTNTITFSGTNKVIDGSSQTNFSNLNITGSYTLNSILEYSGTLTGTNGTLTMGSTGELKINSATNPSVTNFDASTSGNIVHYNFAGAQSILAKNYHHLKLNTSGLKSFVGNTSIAGNLDLLATADLEASTYTITLKGNFTTSGGFSSISTNSSRFILDGSSTQTITVPRSGGFRANKLFISNSEKIFITSQTVFGDTTSIAAGSIYNGVNCTTNTFAGIFTGTGTLKFGSCASPTNATLSISYSSGSVVTLPNFEPTFNQINTLIVNMLSNTRIANINSDLIVSNKISLYGGVATFGGTLSLDGDAPIFDQGGKMNFNGGSLVFGNCVTTGSAVIIPNDIFSSNPTIKNLTINRTNGVTFGNQLISVSEVLTMNAGNLATNNNLALLSSSTKTARVAPITNGSVISGNVSVNKFIPGGSNKRKWRLLSSPINVSGSIALSQFIDDIFVTAPASTGGGFDNSPNNNASIRTYTESTSGASSLGWTNPTNITNTVSTGTGMEVFVRGSRNLANPFLNWTVPDDVTIDYTGTLNVGNITKSLTYTPSTGGATTADGFNLVGNPYASPINFDTTAGWTKTNIENKFWCYNPNTSNYGIYDAVAHTGTNGITRYIASGQAFFVRATSASSPSITFTENVKCIQAGNNYFKSSKVATTYPMLRITLSGDTLEYDEALILIDSTNGSILPTDERDAAKFFNDALNIYTVTKDKSNLAINAINIPTINDTINVSVWSYDSTAISKKQHKIRFTEFETIDPSIDIYLLDQFLNTSINIRNTSEYDFMITSDVNSYGNNRFKLLFNNLGNGVSAQNKNADIILYPNPAQNQLYFKLSTTNCNPLKYEIFDLTGRTHETSEIDVQNTLGMIKIDQLNSGNYIIKITQGDKQIVKKFIKQ